jgi:ABC-type transport system substrate-binding protein
LLRRLAVISLGLAILFAALPARTSRPPRYGGTLRVELGAIVASLDPAIAPDASAETSASKSQIDSLIYANQNPDGNFTGAPGSGPFTLSSWQPGKSATLKANDKFPQGRPFVDAIEITLGRAFRDRLLDLELSKTDLTEIPPQDARHAAERGVRLNQSQPDELLAIAFPENRAISAAETHARQALSLSIDRAAIVTFLLQKTGEPTAALLPQWSSGTSFLFSTSADLPRAKELLAQIAPSPKFVLGYDSADPLEQSVAERIAVNAKEAGLMVIAVGAPPSPSISKSDSAPDARLVRVPLRASQPAAALNNLLRDLNSLAPGIAAGSALPESASPQIIYNREREVLDAFRIVPLVWIPQVYGLSPRVRNWIPPGPGQPWPLADVWLDTQDAPDAKDKSTPIKDPE